MATATKKPEQTTDEALADIIDRFIRERFAADLTLRKDLEDRTNAEAAEYRENVTKMEQAGVNGGLMAQAKDLLTQTEALLETRRARVAMLGDADEIARRIEAAIAFVRKAADPDATPKPQKARGGPTAPRAAKVPFRAWIGGKEVTAASALKSFGLLAFYKVRDRKGVYPVETLYHEFREQANVDLENNPAPGTYEANCNGKAVKIEILGPETATA